MKSHEIHLLGLYTAMIDDCRRYYPGDAREWTRDELRLRKAIEARGSKFFTIDLPAAGKVLDRALSQRLYIPSGLPYQGSARGEVVPRLFRALLSRVFNCRSGALRPDVDVTAVSLLRQLYYAAKKMRMSCEDSATFKAVATFFHIEEGCRRPSLNWDGDDLLGDLPNHHHLRDAWRGRFSHGALKELSLLDTDEWSVEPGYAPDTALADGLCGLIQQVADLLAISIGEIDLSAIRPKHGPGAVSDLKGKSKYYFPNWPMKLELCCPADELAHPNASFMLGGQGDETGPRLGLGEPPSKLIAVPKTQKTPRLIASEPTSHQWCQQGVRTALLSRWKRLFVSESISFTDQSLSQQAALEASAKGSGATIDLSSASDSLSCWVVERFFRRNYSFLKLLHATRTRWLSNGIDKKSPQHVVLKKFAPMGSALTFPVQSMIYAVVAIAAQLHQWTIQPARTRSEWRYLRTACWEAAKHVRIFGDDITCPEDVAPWVTEALSCLGFEVNESKTYIGGNFYESCGVDAYAGIDVTPTYYLEVPVESHPASIISAVECSNNFHKGGMWSTAAWIAGLIPSRLFADIVVKPVEAGAFGFNSFCGWKTDHLTRRWNEDHHCWEVAMLVPSSKTQRSESEGVFSLLQYFTEAPKPDHLGVYPPWAHGDPGRVKTKLRLDRVPVDHMTN